MSKMAIMDVFSDFQVYIEEDQDTREVLLLLLSFANDFVVSAYKHQ